MRDLVREVFDNEFAEVEAKAKVAEAKGEARGRAEGAFSTILASVRNMVIKLKMTADTAMDVLNVAPADRPAILAAL